MIVFVGSKNREIVKSALGFVKVAVVALPAGVVSPHLKTLVPALLGWVHDHKNHFKLKTVHIFERMLRKFGYDEVYRFGGDGNEKKVLEHIKKKKDRAKRQKAARAEAGSGDDGEEEVSNRERVCTCHIDILVSCSDSVLILLIAQRQEIHWKRFRRCLIR